MSQPLISVLLPSRGRPAGLRRSLQSLRDRAQPGAIEFLLRFDEDDEASLSETWSEADTRVFVGVRHGYLGLHHYVNELCAKAKGRWLFLWNDDALMETDRWDEVIASYGDRFLLLNADSNHGNHALGSCIFPIVPRRWVETTGHFSLSNHNDTWVEVVAKQLGVVEPVPIRILHDRVDLTGNNDDETARERQFTTAEFFGPLIQSQIQADIAVLQAVLQRAQRRGQKIGFIGLGNLGLPCALAIEQTGGYQILGYDCSQRALEPLRTKRFNRIEPGVEDLLRTTNLEIASIPHIAEECDIVFVAVQTPHDPRFEGITSLPEERVDFDYSFLVAAVRELADAALEREKPLVIDVISTVLPGTMRREIEPLLNDKCHLCYNPFFIAMGTTIHDFLHPEFVLLGSREPEVAARLEAFYRTLHDRPCYKTDVESAELIKVSYNTFIGLKLAFVNCLMEVCDKTGADVDQVTTALCQATDRLISPKYMRAGMGDGGGCHPRDNIAMSWLARELNLSFDLFEAAMLSRQGHTAWLAEMLIEASQKTGLPIVLLGTAYKADSDLTAGSPALLLADILASKGVAVSCVDPYVSGSDPLPSGPVLAFLSMNHAAFRDLELPAGSILVDPWGTQSDRPNQLIWRPGRRGSPQLATLTGGMVGVH